MLTGERQVQQTRYGELGSEDRSQATSILRTKTPKEQHNNNSVLVINDRSALSSTSGNHHDGASEQNDNGRKGNYHNKAHYNGHYFVYNFQNGIRNNDHRSSHDNNDDDNNDAVYHDDRSYNNHYYIAYYNNNDYDSMDNHYHNHANHHHHYNYNDYDKASTSDLYTSTTASYTATYISSTSSSNSADPIVSPTLAPPVNNSSISTGAIVGIIAAALLGIIAALIAAFMIKRHRRRQIHRTSNTLFNPVNIDMQENHSRYPSGPNGGGSSGGGYGTSHGYFQGLSGRESVEPLNAAMLGASGISAASALGHSDAGTLYPYESDPRYFRRGSTALPQVAEGDGSGEIGYGPTSMDPAYLAYGAYGQHGNQHDPQDEEAYMRYEQQLYQQQLQQDPHQQDLQAPVAYYDPTSGEIYYPDYTAEQQQAYAPSAENGSPSAVDNSLRQQYVLPPNSPHDPHTLPGAPFPGEDDESPEAAAEAAAAARRISDTAMSSSSTYVDAESDAHNSKSAWPILHRSSLLSNTSSSSAGNRNPQGLMDKISTGTTIKVPVPEEAENSSVSN
ncbi:hypothetical protein BGZ75_006168 [Mortierella antarctica]|nr:hypothetical protein BGZ75_006168 [Mortierella antarctica]